MTSNIQPRLYFGPKSIWFTFLAAVTLITAALYWYPFQRISAAAPINYNEGWNSYRAQLTTEGIKLYGSPPLFTATNYPPLSFHLLGFLGRISGDFTAVGRWMSVVSLACLFGVIIAIVRGLTGAFRFGLYAALLFSMGLAIFLPDRIGMNDPQLMGLALSFLGFYMYARNVESRPGLCVSALAFALSLFTKHNLLALPCAVGAHIIVRRAWRDLAVWLGALAALGVTLLLVAYRWDGPYFLKHLLVPRGYYYWGGWVQIVQYLDLFQVPFFVSLLWSIWNVARPERNLFSIAFVLAHGFGFSFEGGAGVVGNVLFEALILVSIISALAVADLGPKLASVPLRIVLVPLLLLAPFANLLAHAPDQLLRNRVAHRLQPKRDFAYRRAVERLKNRPGTALCEDLLMCYDAGKGQVFDAYFVFSQVSIGRLSEAGVLKLIESGTFPTIELSIPPEAPPGQLASMRFSLPEMALIEARYHPVLQDSGFAILVPAGEQ